MARYILIDRCSGYIFGDTADIGGKTLSLDNDDGGIITACRTLDDDISPGTLRDYEVLSHSNPRALASNETGYLVYRADINGSEAVPVIQDGQDREMIEAVERDCRLVGVVRITDHEGGF